MKKKVFKILIAILIGFSLLSGVRYFREVNGTNINEKNVPLEERASEYNEDDRPWGESNYKRIGHVYDFKKDIDENITTASFKEDGIDSVKSLKIYGTDVNEKKFYNKKVFISGVKDNNYDEDYILVKMQDDVNVLDETLMSDISSLKSIYDQYSFTKIKEAIDKVEGSKDYKDYLREMYDDKIGELTYENNKEVQKRCEAEGIFN